MYQIFTGVASLWNVDKVQGGSPGAITLYGLVGRRWVWRVWLPCIQICRYLEGAPQDPDGIVIFGLVLMLLKITMISGHSPADMKILTFFLYCHYNLGSYQSNVTRLTRDDSQVFPYLDYYCYNNNNNYNYYNYYNYYYYYYNFKECLFLPSIGFFISSSAMSMNCTTKSPWSSRK